MCGLLGGGGILENRTSIVISIGILLLNPDRGGREGGLNFARTSLMDAPYATLKNPYANILENQEGEIQIA